MWLSQRSETLVTYALSGFSNIPSMAITLGGLSGLAPQRKQVFSKIVVRALLGGFFSCMVRACVASLLYEPPISSFLWGSGEFVLCFIFFTRKNFRKYLRLLFCCKWMSNLLWWSYTKFNCFLWNLCPVKVHFESDFFLLLE